MSKEELVAKLAQTNPQFIKAIEFSIEKNVAEIICPLDAFDNGEMVYDCILLAGLCGITMHFPPMSKVGLPITPVTEKN